MSIFNSYWDIFCRAAHWPSLTSDSKMEVS